MSYFPCQFGPPTFCDLCLFLFFNTQCSSYLDTSSFPSHATVYCSDFISRHKKGNIFKIRGAVQYVQVMIKSLYRVPPSSMLLLVFCTLINSFDLLQLSRNAVLCEGIKDSKYVCLKYVWCIRVTTLLTRVLVDSWNHSLGEGTVASQCFCLGMCGCGVSTRAR